MSGAPGVVGPWPQRMINPIRNYDWGSTSVLARLQGRRPTGQPEAELWMGAHSSAPSLLEQPDGTRVSLEEAIAKNGPGLLGSPVRSSFGDRLPFLLKILAIAGPLSLQVHPTADRARSGFDGEVDIPGEHRYVDPYAKPEMLYALEPVDTMCGFRSAEEAERLLGLLGTPRAGHLAGLLLGHESEQHLLERVFGSLVTWPEDDREALVDEFRSAARRLLAEAGPARDGALSAADRRTLTWTCRLADRFRGDPLAASPFLLDLIRMEPGEVLFVPAGSPHAYLHGLGVEIMGNSDNVLRAGLTHKPIAVEELLHVVDGDTRPVRDVPFTWLGPNEVVWAPDVAEFQLSRIWLTDARAVPAYSGLIGPQILLCTSGPVRIDCGATSLELAPGESAFVGASGAPLTLTGPGEVFRAAAGGQRLPG